MAGISGTFHRGSRFQKAYGNAIALSDARLYRIRVKTPAGEVIESLTKQVETEDVSYSEGQLTGAGLPADTWIVRAGVSQWSETRQAWGPERERLLAPDGVASYTMVGESEVAFKSLARVLGIYTMEGASEVAFRSPTNLSSFLMEGASEVAFVGEEPAVDGVEATHVDEGADSLGTDTSFTISDLDLGEEDADRRNFVSLVLRDGTTGANTTFSNFQLGGTSPLFSRMVRHGITTTLEQCWLLTFDKPTGVSADLTFDANTSRTVWASWDIERVLNAGSAFPDAIDTAANAFGATIATLVPTLPGDLVLGNCATQAGSSPSLISATGLDEHHTASFAAGSSTATWHGGKSSPGGLVEFDSNNSNTRAMVLAAWSVHPPLNIAVLTASTSHAAATNTRADLEMFGHTVTLIADSTAAATIIAGNYDVVLLVRASGSSTTISSTVVSTLRDLMAADIPLVLGSTGAGMSAGTGATVAATALDLTGTWRITQNSETDLALIDNSHALTQGFPEEMFALYSSNNFRGSVTDGQSFVGTNLANGVGSHADEAALIVIEAGMLDLEDEPLPVRVIAGDFPYSGQSRFTNRGAALLNRKVRLAAGQIG